MTEVAYKPPPLVAPKRASDFCGACAEPLAGPRLECVGCRRDLHIECAMYEIPDGVRPHCEACFFRLSSEKYLREARGNGEYFKERAPRKKRRGRLPWW